MNPIMLIVFAVVLVGMTYFQMRAQKKQAQQRMESLNKMKWTQTRKQLFWMWTVFT